MPSCNTPCPDAGRLRRLLDSQAAETLLPEVSDHLEACSACQKQLESLACQESLSVSVVREAARDRPAPESAYWAALEGVKEELVLTRAAPETREPDPTLEFLRPTNKPGLLGLLAHFEVVRVLGRGGMGVVLHAHDTCLERDVAVKVLDPTLARDDTARARFCREARSAASITHENVVAVHHVDDDETSELPYLVMQLIDGESLDERLRRGRLSLEQVVSIGMQAASGLAAAHARGLIHRDIKPGNIMLARGTDRVMLTDFGLARATEDIRLTRTGLVAGTPLYMAPEQARGENVDPRADLFSLGVVLYELCTGKTPFDAPTPLAVLRRISDEAHRPVRELSPNTPLWLAELIDDLLAKQPARRPASAEGVARTFEQHWVALRSSSGTLPSCPRAYRRRKMLMILASLVAGVVLGAGLTGWWLWPRAAAAEDLGPEPLAVFPGNAGTVWAMAFSRDDRTLAMAIENGTLKFWDARAFRLMDTIAAHSGAAWAVVLSPDGKTWATAGDDGKVKLWPEGADQPARELPHGDSMRALAFDSKGTRLVSGGRQGAVILWDPQSGQKIREWALGGAVYATAFLGDGQAVAATGSDGRIIVWDTRTGRQRYTLSNHAGPVYSLAVSPDGQTLASAGWDRVIRLWDFGSGTQIRALEGHAMDIWSVGFSPDGSRLASAGQDGTVRLWDVTTGEQRAVFRGHRTTVHSVAFGHGGKVLASGGRDGTARLWDIQGK